MPRSLPISSSLLELSSRPYPHTRCAPLLAALRQRLGEAVRERLRHEEL